jgi:hypothetical protein
LDVDDEEEERKKSQLWVEEKSCGRSGYVPDPAVMCLTRYLRTACNPYLPTSNAHATKLMVS